MAGGKGKSIGGKATGAKDSGSKSQKSHSAKAGLQVRHSILERQVQQMGSDATRAQHSAQATFDRYKTRSGMRQQASTTKWRLHVALNNRPHS